ncbi:hypothetical protein [Rudanella lutea]|uniref:hypothetical protein n=1 Tax=Rudanella lutea TaxID=451374 RepID=UPI00035F3062|nr:hypothetical protein [Rudanella lutea]
MKKPLLTLACAIAILSLTYAYTVAATTSASLQTRTVAMADSVDLNQYAGKFKFEGLPFEYLTIAVKEGKLTVSTGEETGELTPIKDTPDAYDAAGRAKLQFVRDENKKVKGISLDAQGMIFEGKKE